MLLGCALVVALCLLTLTVFCVAMIPVSHNSGNIDELSLMLVAGGI